MPDFELETGCLHYRDSGGPGDDRSVIIAAHGFLMDSRMYAGATDELDEVRWISWDTRGHGGSRDHPGTPQFSYWDQARDALALLDHLGVTRAIFLGQSQGGFVAERMALVAPRRCRGLVLVSVSAEQYTDRERIGYDAVFGPWITSPETRFARADLIAASIIAGDKARNQQPWIDRWLARDDWEGFEKALYCLINHDRVLELLDDVSVPSLLMHGTEDQAVTRDQVDRLRHALKAEMHVVQGGSHNLPLADPAGFADALRGWLSRHDLLTPGTSSR